MTGLVAWLCEVVKEICFIILKVHLGFCFSKNASFRAEPPRAYTRLSSHQLMESKTRWKHNWLFSFSLTGKKQNSQKSQTSVLNWKTCSYTHAPSDPNKSFLVVSVDLWPKESIGKPTRVPAATFDQTFIQNFANPSPPHQNLAKYTSPPHPLLDRPTFGWQNNLKESNGGFF